MTTSVTIKSLPAAPYASVVVVLHEKDNNGVELTREHVLAYGAEHMFYVHGDQRITVVESKALMIGPPLPKHRDQRDYRKAIPERNDPAPFLEDTDPA